MGAGRELNTFDEFVEYRSRENVGYFNKWRKCINDTQGEAKVALHTKRKPIVLWQHQGIPRVKVYERNGVEVEELWGGDDNCYETEEVIAKQYLYNQQGNREVVPLLCGHCRLGWFLGEQVRLSERERVMAMKAHRAFDPTIGIPFYTPAFRFSARDAQKDRVLFAGSMVLGRKGMPKWDQLASDVRDLLKASHMNMQEVWGQDNHARKMCLFTLVGVAGGPDSDLTGAAGVSVAMERGVLFDRMQTEIVAQFKRKQSGKDVHPDAKRLRTGDPWCQPYPFHWQYDKAAAEIKDMYQVTALEERVTPEVMALITSPAPDVSNRCRHFHQRKLRLFLEANATIDLPWDTIFGRNEGGKWVPLEEEGGEDAGLPCEDGDSSFPHGANAQEVGRGLEEKRPLSAQGPAKALPSKAKPTKASTGRPFPIAEDDVDNDENVLLCDDGGETGCKQLMWSTDHTCPHCGHVWDPAAANEEKKAAEAAKKAETKPRKRRAAGTATTSAIIDVKGEAKPDDDVGF